MKSNPSSKSNSSASSRPYYAPAPTTASTTPFQKSCMSATVLGVSLTFSFADLYPELSDALILTGFSLDTAYVGLFEAGANFVSGESESGGEVWK
jgi:hypothetical protein